MAANLYTNQEINVRKTWLLMGVFFVLIILIGWFASWYFNSFLILYFAVFFSILMNVTSFWYSDKVVLKITGAKEAKKETYRELYNIVENLSITAGLPMPKIYIINDSVPNAFATGRDKNHAVIVFTTGILDLLNRSELEGVASHELAHIGNKDILLQTVVVVLVGFITLISDFILRSSFRGGNNNERGNGRLQLILMVIGIILVILSPVVGTIIQLAISRKREFLADSTGALLTRYPEGLASALEKISTHSGKMQRANHATAHLFISNPFGDNKNKKSRGFLDTIFLTHPPVEQRIANLRGLK
jgi:heat shock protein HtpX